LQRNAPLAFGDAPLSGFELLPKRRPVHGSVRVAKGDNSHVTLCGRASCLNFSKAKKQRCD
jgi:hypothetical protein